MKSTNVLFFLCLLMMTSIPVIGNVNFPQEHPPCDHPYSRVVLAELKKMGSSELPKNINVSGYILFFAWDLDDGYDGYIFSSREDMESVDVNRGVKVVIPIDLARRLKTTGLVKHLNKKPVTIYGTATLKRLFESRQVVILFDYLQENTDDPNQKDQTATR